MTSNIPDYIPLPKDYKDSTNQRPFVSLLQPAINNNKASTYRFSKKKQSHAQSVAAKLISRSIIKQASVTRGNKDLNNKSKQILRKYNPKLTPKNRLLCAPRKYADQLLQRVKLKESMYRKNNNFMRAKPLLIPSNISRSKYIKRSMPSHSARSNSEIGNSNFQQSTFYQTHKGRKKNDEDCCLSEDYFWAPGEKESLKEDAEQSFRRSLIRIVPKFLFD